MRRSTFDLHNAVTNGHLAGWLTGWHADGVSFEEMTWRLRERGVHVSRSTVRRWVRNLATEAA